MAQNSVIIAVRPYTMNKHKHLIVLVGPTAIGKTRLSIQLAKHFNCDIISADSRQFYKEMSIGTAAPSKEELQQAKHHFIQHISIQETYSVGDFEKEALATLEKLFETNEYAIVVGGSGLYVDAITKGLDLFPAVSPDIRETLNKRIVDEGITSLQEQLKILDPEYYLTVDIHNTHRVMRALEICIGSGKPYSSFITKTPKKRPFNILKIGLTADRPIIYDRINQRVDIMHKEGLLDEVKGLYPHIGLNALNTVGYKELFEYLNGNWALEFALSEIKKNTRRFAKRQLTWFRKDQEITWFDYLSPVTKVIAHIMDNKLQN